MFLPSAANDTLQGRAIQKINEKWGVHINSKDNDRNPSLTCKSISHRNKSGSTGAETIGIPVCKKKYAPFEFRKKVLDDDGRVFFNNRNSHKKCNVGGHKCLKSKEIEMILSPTHGEQLRASAPRELY